jgi:hypothetical protein
MGEESHHQKNPQKYFQKVTFFRASRSPTQLTTKNHELTTFSPQKIIQKKHKYAQTPCKNAESPRQKNSRTNPHSQRTTRPFPSCCFEGSGSSIG